MNKPTITDERIIKTFKEQNGFDLMDNLVMACHIGSISHGTNLDTGLDDVDIFAVAFPTPERQFGLHKWEHWTLQVDELDVIVYSLEKYVRLLVQSNPNVIGTLWLESEFYTHRTPYFETIMENRALFSTLKAYGAFCGYAQSQLHRLENGAYKGYMGEKRKKLVDKFGYDPKNASHVIRLYTMGIEFVRTGELKVFRSDCEMLKDIKRGEWSLDDIKTHAKKLEAEMEEAKNESTLPDAPDSKKVDFILVDLYKKHFRVEAK